MFAFVLFWLACATLFLCLAVGARLTIGGSRLRQLRDVEPLTGALPRVSVIIPARNEARDIEPALSSILKLDYENMQLIVVNDRSTDDTGRILERMAAQHPQIEVVHVQTLPAGWLGKNHALYCGSKRADGEWLLFTDADVVMEPSTLRRAIAYATRESIDHLPMLFQVRMPSVLLEAFVIVFSIYFFTYFRPWKIRDPKSMAHIGVGGFNLIRRSTYDAIGNHTAIAMRPDDDVKLGKIVKKHGFRQDLLLAQDFMYVPWYSSLRELILGLEKNTFAGVEYRIWLVVLSSLMALLFNVFPFVAVFLSSGITQVIFGTSVAIMLFLASQAARANGVRLGAALLFPVAVILFVYIQWRTMALNLWFDGIRWRDTHYSLAELKSNRV